LRDEQVSNPTAPNESEQSTVQAEAVQSFLKSLEQNGNESPEESSQLTAKQRIEAISRVLPLMQEFSGDLPDNWFITLLTSYHEKYGEQLPMGIQKQLLAFIGDQKKSHKKRSSDELQEALRQQLRSRLKLNDGKLSSVDEEILQTENEALTFVMDLLDKSELSADWHNQILMEYEDYFGMAMPPEIQKLLAKLRDEQVSNPTAPNESEQSTVQAEAVQSFLKSLENNGEESAAASTQLTSKQRIEAINHILALMAEFSGNLPDNWFATLLTSYHKKYGEQLPMGIQKQLLAFIGDQKKSHKKRSSDKLQEALREQLKSRLKQNDSKVSGADEETLQAENEALNFVLGLLDNSELSVDWDNQLLMDYEDHFGMAVSAEVQEMLADLRDEKGQKSAALSESEQSALQFEAVDSYLRSLESARGLGSKERRQKENENEDADAAALRSSEQNNVAREELLEILRGFGGSLPKNWFQALLQAYQTKYGKKMPVSHQSLLLAMMDEQLIGVPQDPSSAAKKHLRERLETRMKQIKDKRLAAAKQREAGQDKLKENEALFFVSELLERLSLGGDWHSQILQEYKAKFAQPMPAGIRKLLADMQREQEVELPTGKAGVATSNLKKLLSFVKSKRKTIHFIENQSEEQSREFNNSNTILMKDNESIEQLLELIEGFKYELPDNWFQMLLKAYQEKYGMAMPIECQAILLDFMQRFETMKESAVDSSQPQEDSANAGDQAALNKHAQPEKQSRKGTEFSKEARLLQLKQALKNKSDSAEIILVSNAGIIAGWVLWKRQFEKMGWLKDGLFIRQEGKNTAILAANWLARLCGDVPASIDLLLAAICGLSEEERTLYSNEEMNRAVLPLQLDETIRGFNEQLLSLWPIMNSSHQAEFLELFIMREGIISKTAVGWSLAIVKAPQDGLMDRTPLPWPISLIQFSWSTGFIEATW
jgi:hypothetical protein